MGRSRPTMRQYGHKVGSAALHGRYYPKSGYDAALQRMT
jgi:hypothetical protein